jgi:hypothetical protein
MVDGEQLKINSYLSIVPSDRVVVINDIVIQLDVVLHSKRLLLQSTSQSWLHKIACCGDMRP